MISSLSTRVALIAVCLLIFLSSFEATAQRWRTIDAQESIIQLVDWPDDLPCRYRDGSYNQAFSMKRSAVFCPGVPAPAGDRTYIYVLELQPGYFWAGGYANDIRKLWVFQREKGYFAFFKDAEFEAGQRFECYNDNDCGFRTIRFKVADKPCHLTYYNPDIGNTDGTTGQSRTPFSIVLIHCGSDVAFTRQHFALSPDRVTISYPDTARSAKSRENPVMPNAALCRMALNGTGDGWQELGFAPYITLAKLRGLSVSACKALTRAAEPAAPVEAPATRSNKPTISPGFTSCFDNPKNCR